MKIEYNESQKIFSIIKDFKNFIRRLFKRPQKIERDSKFNIIKNILEPLEYSPGFSNYMDNRLSNQNINMIDEYFNSLSKEWYKMTGKSMGFNYDECKFTRIFKESEVNLSKSMKFEDKLTDYDKDVKRTIFEVVTEFADSLKSTKYYLHNQHELDRLDISDYLPKIRFYQDTSYDIPLIIQVENFNSDEIEYYTMTGVLIELCYESVDFSSSLCSDCLKSK